MSTFLRRLGWSWVWLSLLLHLFTVSIFFLQPDRYAAFTVMPIWLWGGFGMLLSFGGFYLIRTWRSLIMTVVWVITLLVGADESSSLLHLGKPSPQPGRVGHYKGQRTMRVVTMNCAVFHYGSPAADIAAWQPDILLLQDTYPFQVTQIAQALYGGQAEFRAHLNSGIATRWKILRVTPHPDARSRDQLVTILRPDGKEIEVVNVHLPTAATDLRLWRKSAWSIHRGNRQYRKNELALTREVLARTTRFPNTPTILGGDFNAPATDMVHHMLKPDFVDAFTAVGTGWGNTFQRRLPILRIDHIYATRHFTPVRSRVVMSRHSDHRMVVADFLMDISDSR